MTAGQVIRFLLDRGFPIPSPAVLGKIGRDYVNRVNDFIAAQRDPDGPVRQGGREGGDRSRALPGALSATAATAW